jgi:hypothetical protein
MLLFLRCVFVALADCFSRLACFAFVFVKLPELTCHARRPRGWVGIRPGRPASLSVDRTPPAGRPSDRPAGLSVDRSPAGQSEEPGVGRSVSARRAQDLVPLACIG